MSGASAIGRTVAPLFAVAACFSPSYDNPTCGPRGACPPGFTCVASQCLRAEGIDAPDVRDDAPPDTPPGADLCTPAAALCTSAGGQCTNGTCIIIRNATTAVTCPTGMPCHVTCEGPLGCDDGVRCGGATECKVFCQATQCATGGVDCGTATKCTVRCIGSGACRRGTGAEVSVECRASMCDVTCALGNNQTCEEGIDVDLGGTCAAHCCDGACPAIIDTACTRDTVCI